MLHLLVLVLTAATSLGLLWAATAPPRRTSTAVRRAGSRSGRGPAPTAARSGRLDGRAVPNLVAALIVLVLLGLCVHTLVTASDPVTKQWASGVLGSLLTAALAYLFKTAA